MNLPHVITIESDLERLPIGTPVLPSYVLRRIVQEGVIVLWDFRGLWFLIPPEVSANALASYDQWQAAKGAWNKAPDSAMGIRWQQTVQVPVQVARVLRGDPASHMHTLQTENLRKPADTL